MDANLNNTATDNLNQLNQVADAPDLTVSNDIIKAQDLGKVGPGDPPTKEELEANRKKSLLLGAASIGGAKQTGAGFIQPRKDVDRYKKYLPNTGGIYSTPQDMWDKERALNQSNWEQSANSLIRVGANIIPEILQQGSRMLDFTGDYSKDNAIGEAMQKWKDSVNEDVAPIYRENPNESMDFGDFAYWMDQGSNLVTSAAAFAAIGYATAGVGGLAAKGLGGLAKATTGARTGAGIANFLETTGNGLANAYLLNRAEGVGVAIDTYKEMELKTIQELRDNNGVAKKSEAQMASEAKAKAAQAAAYAFNFNKVNIALNISSSMAFIKPFARGSRLKLDGDALSGGALNSTVRTAGQRALANGATYLKEGAQEYAEETINLIAQKRAVAGDDSKPFRVMLNGAMEDAVSAEGIESGFWGALGGIGQTAATKVGRYIPMHSNTAYKDAYDNAVGTLQNEVKKGTAEYTDAEIATKATEIATEKAGTNKKLVSNAYLDNYRQRDLADKREEVLSMFKPDIADGEEDTGGNRNKILKTSDMFKTVEDQMTLYDEQEAAFHKGDTAKVNEISEQIFTNQVGKAIANGTLNTLEQSIQGIQELTPDQAKEQGFYVHDAKLGLEGKEAKESAKNDYRAKAKEALNTIKKIETSHINNEKYLNNDDVNDIDREIIIQDKLGKFNNEQFIEERDKAFRDDYKDNHLTTPYLKGSIEDYNKLSSSEKQALYSPEQISAINEKVKWNDAKTRQAYNTPTKEELAANPELDRLWKNKKIVDDRLEALLGMKADLTSKETQDAIKNVQIQNKKEAIALKQQLEEAVSKKKNDDKQAKRVAADQAKTLNDKKTQIKERDSAKEKEIEVPIQKVETVVDPETGTVVVKPQAVLTPAVEVTTNLSDNPNFAPLQAAFGVDSQFVKDLETYAVNVLDMLEKTSKEIAPSWFEQVIAKYEARIPNTVANEKALYAKYPELEVLFDAGVPLDKLISSFIGYEVNRLNQIQKGYQGLQEVVTALNNELKPAEPADLGALPEDESVSLEDIIAQRSGLNLSSSAVMFAKLSDVISSLKQNGIRIEKFNDLYIQLINASSKQLVDNVLPRIKNFYDALVNDNVLNGNILDADAFTIDEVAQDIEEKTNEQMLSHTWSKNDENVLDENMGELVDEMNKTMKNRTVVRMSGTGKKALTSFKIAWNAREWIGTMSADTGILREDKSDMNDDLNEGSSYKLFDPSELPVGTDLTFIPLGVGKVYDYFDARTGIKHEITRLDKDTVKYREYDGDTLVVDEIRSGIDQLPIFVSTSSNPKDIIQGAFLHTPDKVNSDNFGGTEQEAELQRQMLIGLRAKVVDNLNKNQGNKRLVKVKLTNKSMGIPITSPNFETTEKRLETPVEIAMVVSQGDGLVLKTGGNVAANPANHINMAKQKMGATFVLVPVGNEKVAIPIKKQQMGVIAPHIVQSITSIVDLHFTPDGSYTEQQIKDAKEFKKLGLDVKSFKDVKNYLSNFLYVGLIPKANKRDFADIVEQNQKKYNDTSLFRFTEDRDSKQPILQFGIAGSSVSEIQSSSFEENKEALLAELKEVLDNSYVNTNVNNINGSKQIVGMEQRGEELVPAVLFKSYNAMINNVTETNLQPTVITNPKNGKQKIIYTFQQTFELSDQINGGRPKKTNPSNTASLFTQEEGVAEEEETVQEEEVYDQEPEGDNAIIEETEFDSEDYDLEDLEAFDMEFDSGQESDSDLEAAYTFIKGVTTPIQNSIVSNIKNIIEQHIINTKTPITFSQAVRQVLAKLDAHVVSINANFDKEVAALEAKGDSITEEQRLATRKRLDKIVTINNLIANKVAIIKANEDKIIKKVKLTLKQDGIVVGLKGKDRLDFLQNQLELAERIKKQKEQVELGLAEGKQLDELDSSLLTDENLGLEAYVDEEGEHIFDLDSISVNPQTSLAKEVRAFFGGVRNIVFKKSKKYPNGKYVPEVNYLGQYNYVPFNTVYQKVQEILAIHPGIEHVIPTYENYVLILKSKQDTVPYLMDVVEKLNGDVSEQFKNQFMAGMYKMYNNTVFLHTKYNSKEKQYTSYLVNTDSNNYRDVIKNQWKTYFNNSEYTVLVNEASDTPVRKIREEVKEQVRDLFYTMRGSYDDIAYSDFEQMLELIGIELPQGFKDAAYDMYDGVSTRGISIDAIVRSPMMSNMIHSIIGDPLNEAFPGIQDILTEEMYGDSSFNNFIAILSDFYDAMGSNSSKSIAGENIFNYGEVKNAVDTFNKLKYNINYFREVLEDPYRYMDTKAQRDNKKYQTWAEQMVQGENDNLQYNTSSSFYRAFKYLTFTGDKLVDDTGTTVHEIEKYTEAGYAKAKLNLFLNQGNTIGGERTAVSNYMFFTMSDKKVPLAFSATSINFTPSIFAKDFSKLKNLREVEQQLNYLFDTLVKPDVQRMLAFDKPGFESKINIKEYQKENSKFYNIPYLNLIDFDYEGGISTNEKLGDDSLRESLNLEAGENLFTTYLTESNKIKREVNTTVLQKPEVQAFVREKMREHLTERVKRETEFLKEQNILGLNDEGNYDFTAKSGIDTGALARRKAHAENANEIDSEDSGTYSLVMNYVLNSTVALGQFQQLLVGDPIQFNKGSDQVKEIKKELENNLTRKIGINDDFANGIISADEALGYIEDLGIENQALIDRYNKAWALDDVAKTNDNQGKRLAGDNASGTKIVNSKDNTSFNLLVLEDSEVGTKDRDFFIRELVPLEVREMPEDTIEQSAEKKRIIDDIIYNYDNITQTDGQELTTLKEHLDILTFLGDISKDEAARILKADDAGSLTMEDYKVVLQPMKLVYSNNFMRDGINSRLYVKSSSFPLSKTFTKGLPIAKLMDFMEANNVQRATFKSAVKAGQPKGKALIFNDSNDVNDLNEKSLNDALMSSIVYDVPRDGHKKQQNIPFDETKHAINDGTQKAKLKYNNLMEVGGFIHPETGKPVAGRQLYESNIEVYRQYYETKYNELKAELFPNGYKYGLDYKKLREVIIKEAEDRGFSENDMAYFELNPTESGFKFPLWLGNNEGKLTSLLNSIVDNRIRKRKREGKSAVLLSDIVLNTNPKYDQTNIVYTTLDRGDSLRTMVSEDGVVTKAEVVMSFPLRDNKGKKLDINKFIGKDGLIDMDLISPEVLESIGFRIPTQGLNSMSAIKIIGFLPPGYEDIVIAPKEFIAQMGSDFDVDKLFQDLYNTVYEDGKVRKLTKADYEQDKEFKAYREKLKAIKKRKEKADITLDEAEKRNLIKEIDIIAKELADIRGDVSQSDYLERARNTPNNVELRYLENLMTDYDFAVLLNPAKEVIGQINQPIDSAVFRKITEDIVKVVYQDEVDPHWSALSDSYQSKKYISARGGKTGVSTYSATSVANTIYQTVSKYQPMFFQFYNTNSKQYQRQDYYLFGKKNKNLNDPMSNDGTFKSDIIQALQSISVDNENLQMMHKIGLNDFTSDFVRGAIGMGYTADDIFYLINHPVITAYNSARELGTAKKVPNYYRLEKDDKGKEVRVPYSNAEIKDALKSLTHEDAIEAITKGTYEMDSLQDFAVYWVFEEFTKKGEVLKSIEGLLNIDSKGLGSNLFYSMEKEDAILKLLGNKEIYNVSKLLGDFQNEFAESKDGIALNEKGITYVDKQYKEERAAYDAKLEADKYVQLRGKWFKPTNIASIATVYALVTNNKVWAKDFPYNGRQISSITDFGLRLENNKSVDKFGDISNVSLKTDDDLKNSKTVMLDSIATTSPKRDSDIKQKTLGAFKSFLFSGVTQESAEAIRRELFENNNLADIVIALKNSNVVTGNTFIKKLVRVDEQESENRKRVTKVASLHNLHYNASTLDSVEENGIVNDIIELIKSDKNFTYKGKTFKVSDIGKALVTHQLVTGGIQKAKQFVKHIPPQYLADIGIYDKANTVLAFDESIALFKEQYIQHFPNLVASTSLNVAIADDKVKIENNILTLTVEELVLEGAGNYISVAHPSGTYDLYKRSYSKTNQFYRIPTLGKNGINEYDVNAKGVVRSIFENNNPKYEWYAADDVMNILAEKEILPKQLTDSISDKLTKGRDNTYDGTDKITKVCK